MMEHVDPSGLKKLDGIGKPLQTPKGVYTSKVNVN